jgi:hypothetical protein
MLPSQQIITFDELHYGERFRAVERSGDVWIRLFPFSSRQYMPVPENDDSDGMNAIVWDTSTSMTYMNRRCARFKGTSRVVSEDR